MKIKFKIWLEQDGISILSDGRIAMLKAVQQYGSISQAAKLMHIPYRKAWESIHEMEKRLNCQLIITEKGGNKGGKSTLTENAISLISDYDAFRTKLDQWITTQAKHYFLNNPVLAGALQPNPNNKKEESEHEAH